MANALTPERVSDHCAVFLDNYVIVFGGWLRHENLIESPHVIWTYNLYKEQWRKHVLGWEMRVPRPFVQAAAAAIDKTIYVFGGQGRGGYISNATWMLHSSGAEIFEWSRLNLKPLGKEQSPSPRAGHTGWEHATKLWIFGGFGDSLQGYLNNNGDTEEFLSEWSERLVKNNQLLCFHPKIEMWMNPRCFGYIPSPRSSHASVIINDKVWIFGGTNHKGDNLRDMFELRMNSLTWSRIQPAQSHPKPCPNCILTAEADGKLVSHGGHTEDHTITVTDTWVTDHRSQVMEASWRMFTSRKDAHKYHIGSTLTYLNNRVLIIGGDKSYLDTCDMYNIFDAILGPKSLQQVAMQRILKYQNELPLNCLPEKLLSLMALSVKDQNVNSESKPLH